MENTQNKKIKKIAPLKTSRMIETIYGCKWSLTIFQLIKEGIIRPGEMVRNVEGLSTKVLNTCLKKSIEFNILEKKIYQELPPKVEYSFTFFGKKFLAILDQIESLEKEV